MELIKIQEDIRLQLQKAKVNFKKSPKERISRSYIETRIEIINNKWKEFTQNHYEILKSKETVGSSYFLKDIHNEVEEFYLDFKSELSDLLDGIKGSAEATRKSCTEIKVTKTPVRLPKIAIPTFSGRYTEWITFRDLFVSLIHNNGDIDNVQKLHYLKGHLTGEAEQLLRHIAITNDNYEQCWNILEQRYNNKQFLVNNIFSRFFAQRNLTTESATSLKQLLDNTTDMMQGLQNLGVDTTSWDAIIIYIVSQKLDAETRKQWEAKVSEITFNCNVLPDFKQFQNFLKNRFHSLEFLDTKPISNFKHNQTSKCHVNNSQYISQSNCSYCQGNHRISSCNNFVKLDNNAKRLFIQNNKLCFNCLGNGHSVKFCKSTTSCHICKRRHHSLLHSSSSNMEPLASPQVLEDKPEKGSLHISKGGEQISLLPTAIVYVKSKNGTIPLRALIDQGSHISFITQAAVQLLGIKRQAVKGHFAGLGGEINVVSNSKTDLVLHSLYNPDCTVQVTAFVLEKITGFLPPQRVSVASWPILKDIKLADPNFHSPNKIDLLLGSDVYGNILMEGIRKCSAGSLLAQATIFGWILTGTNQSQAHSVNIVSMHVQSDDFLKSFWEMENEPKLNQKIMSEEEKRCEEIYSATTTRDESGRYIVKLPFRDENPTCQGQTREVALRRFLKLEQQLARNENLKKEFKQTFDEYVELQHMRPINNEDSKIGVHLPYHAVIREDKTTTKVRVVFDASCKGKNGVSLNEDLMVGPTLQSELRHVILRWRTHRICLSADITKMYRQIRVGDDDADYQRIFWRDAPEKDLIEYKILRVTFGTSSAPYLAVRTLLQLAIDEGSKYPLVVDKVKRDFYMDDFMSGCENVKEAMQIFNQLNGLLEKGGFQLQKWKSNDKAVMKMIEREGKGERVLEEGKGIEEQLIEGKNKILGLTWNRNQDEFEYAVNLPAMSAPVTKRKVISDISRLYDPLGWIAPSIISAKIFIQKLWMSGLGWDEELPQGLLEEWITYRKNLTQLTNFRLPRWMKSESNNRLVEIHGFCDASNVAYGAVVYLRVVTCEGRIEVSLISAKTRVAPIKQVSIPRLELCGAVLLAKLLVEVGTVLDVPKKHWHAWTDSEVVLAWLSSHPSKWKPFIGNRVATIITLLERNQWSYVKSETNPADAASRGVKPSDIHTHQLWANGPNWLKHQDVPYVNPKNLTTHLEERKKFVNIAIEEHDNITNKFSSLSRLLRVVAYCRRFLKKERDKVPKHFHLLKIEIQEALDCIIKQCQIEYFKQEMQDISNGKNIKAKSKLTSLSPYIDNVGILRVGGRLQSAQVEGDRKHPILIPHDAHLAKLIVGDAHVKTLHGGPLLMLNYIRSRYWIIRAKNIVKFHYRNCVKCTRYRTQIKNQLMGQLPAERISPSRPFSFSGVDYAGPINIRVSKGRGNKSYKGYICLFVCMSTRAIHLEAVSDLTTQGFLSAYKRFVARRGHCSNLYSDNGCNFVGAARELKVLLHDERSNLRAEISDWLATNGTQWHFIPPHAPNFGGLWEAGVKSTKYHLTRVIGNSTLTFEEISTILSQIEACLNSRPISYMEEQDDILPLTPGHFLVGEPLVLPPDRNYEQTTLSSLRRWQLCQRMLQHFWRRWSQEYLSGLMQRRKWNRLIPEPVIGDVVLVREPDLPPARWLMGKIVKKHPGVDNVTRVVTLRYKNSYIKRPLSKIVILPISKN